MLTSEDAIELEFLIDIRILLLHVGWSIDRLSSHLVGEAYAQKRLERPKVLKRYCMMFEVKMLMWMQTDLDVMLSECAVVDGRWMGCSWVGKS